MARPTSGQVWPRPLESSGGSFPDSAADFGTAHVDDEEWEEDDSAWTVETNPSSSNTYDVNGAFSPSRLRFHSVAATGDVLSLVKAVTDGTGDISVTFDAAGVFNGNYRSIQIGFRETLSSTGADAMVGVLGFSTNITVIRRKYTSISAGTFTDQATVTLTDGDEPRRYFMHLQRVSNTWSLWYSNDAISWDRVGSTTSDSFTTGFLWVQIGGFGAAGGAAPDVPYYLSNHWIRLNRFFL